MGDEVRSHFIGHGRRSLFAPFRLPMLATCASALLLLSACSFGGDNDKSRGSMPPPSAPAAEIPQSSPVMDTFRALAPPEGMKFTQLFAQPVRSDNERFSRLEQSVQALRNDFDTVMPTMVRLAAIEKDIRGLVEQLETLTSGMPADTGPVPVPEVEAQPVVQAPAEAPPVNTAPEKEIPQEIQKEIPGEDVVGGTEGAASNVAAATPKTPSSPVTPGAAPAGQLPPEGAAPTSSRTEAPISIAPAPKAAAEPKPDLPAAENGPPPQKPAAGQALGIRVGDHLDKTRLVIELSAKPEYAAAVENGGKRLVVSLPGMEWKAAPSWEADAAALVSAYAFAGGKLNAEMLYASEIKGQQVLPPSDDHGNYRLVIDLFSPDVHQ